MAQCYSCEKEAAGQCKYCQRFYCKDHYVVVRFRGPMCSECYSLHTKGSNVFKWFAAAALITWLFALVLRAFPESAARDNIFVCSLCASPALVLVGALAVAILSQGRA